LTRLSDHFETELAPQKPVWTMDKMAEEDIRKMERMIVPVILEVSKIEATWKLNQNKPEGIPSRAAAHLPSAVSGSELPHLAELMKR
jgi:transcriptional regulator